MTEISVALILRTASISLPQLEAIIGVPPSRGHSRGDIRFRGRRKHFRTPLAHTTWILSSDEPSLAALNNHVDALTKVISPDRVRELREKLPSDLRIEIDVALFYQGQGGYLDVEPRVLNIVTAYGATLLVSAYFDEKESGRTRERDA